VIASGTRDEQAAIVSAKIDCSISLPMRRGRFLPEMFARIRDCNWIRCIKIWARLARGDADGNGWSRHLARIRLPGHIPPVLARALILRTRQRIKLRHDLKFAYVFLPE
jgi:hypothetical protein